jgi:type I restriction enzyme M protein
MLRFANQVPEYIKDNVSRFSEIRESELLVRRISTIKQITMLDQDTKRRIDTARDILVGKLPNPQAQVEQITIAMIYKFMDDMDKEAMEFGGEATFFTGEFEKYSWTKIFDPKLGGFEMLALYGEAIVKLNQNPSIPQLFRDIFKNAFLPYRDPETLKMFLKIINEFHYDHSEKLGDAFEYLIIRFRKSRRCRTIQNTKTHY